MPDPSTIPPTGAVVLLPTQAGTWPYRIVNVRGINGDAATLQRLSPREHRELALGARRVMGAIAEASQPRGWRAWLPRFFRRAA